MNWLVTLNLKEKKFVIVDFIGVTKIIINDDNVEVATLLRIHADSYNKKLKVVLISNNKELQALLGKYTKNNLKHLPHSQQKIFEDTVGAQAWASS